MRMVNLKQFLALPAGTIYHEYKRCITGPLSKKHDTISDKDWIEETFEGMPKSNGSEELFDRLDEMEKGKSFPLEHEGTSRNSLYRDEQLFIVYERDDIVTLMLKLDDSIRFGCA